MGHAFTYSVHSAKKVDVNCTLDTIITYTYGLVLKCCYMKLAVLYCKGKE